MPLSLWMRLQSALLYSKKINRCEIDLDSDGKYLADFLNKIRRGSKKFRQVIDKSRYLGDCPSKLLIVSTFAKLTNTPSPSPDCLKNILSSWNNSHLENHFRDFLYKFRHNILRTKDRLSHLIVTETNCLFCKSFSVPIYQKETFMHLFRSCPFTSNTLLKFLNLNRIVIPVTTSSFDEAYWYGSINQSTCKPSLLLFDCFRYGIWHFKNRKKIPTLTDMNMLVTGILSGYFAKRPHFLDTFLNVPHLTYYANTFQARG
jgi:hypothetical protein